MSDRLRTTQRRGHSHRADARRTLRAQVGGVRGKGEPWYFITDTVRAGNWITALRKASMILDDTVYDQLANVIDKKDWGTPTPELLDLYLHIVERQDTLFSIAIGIINKLLEVSPDAPDYAQAVIAKLQKKGADAEKAYKEYIYDVYNLIMCGSYPTLNRSEDAKFLTKLEGLQKETLASILLWPARVKNILIDSIADILISLKANPSILDSASSLKELFNDQYNAYIMTNAIDSTSKGLRDGFYLWDEVKLSAAPFDDCAQSSCKIKVSESIQFWINFYDKYISSVNDDDIINLITNNKDIRGHMFSNFIANIFKKYKSGKTIAEIRNEFVTVCGTKSGATPTIPTISDKSVFGTKEFRPAAVHAINDTATSGVMRVLTPEQYTFLYHLLYVMEQKERAAATPSAAASDD